MTRLERFIVFGVLVIALYASYCTKVCIDLGDGIIYCQEQCNGTGATK